MKSYENMEFINSSLGRSIRILSEFLEPYDRLKKHNINNTIVFFGSARIISKEQAEENLLLAKKNGDTSLIEKSQKKLAVSKYYEQAVELSRRLSLWSKSLENNDFFVCTGGGPGIMEAANKGAYLAKCKNIGLNIKLPFEQFDNNYISKELVFNFNYFFMRKFWFAYLAKAIIIFPGGFGTLDEFFEIMTLIQTHKLKKVVPIVLFGSDEFFDQLINFDVLKKYNLIEDKDTDIFFKVNNVDDAFNYITHKLESYINNEEQRPSFNNI